MLADSCLGFQIGCETILKGSLAVGMSVAPSPSAISPETRPSHGYTRSGANTWVRASTTNPSASTDAVCITATEPPTATACRTRPPAPTR